MTKAKRIHPEIVWKKGETRPCQGKCGHQHVAKTGPCTELGCGCHGSYGKKKAS